MEGGKVRKEVDEVEVVVFGSRKEELGAERGTRRSRVGQSGARDGAKERLTRVDANDASDAGFVNVALAFGELRDW